MGYNENGLKLAFRSSLCNGLEKIYRVKVEIAILSSLKHTRPLPYGSKIAQNGSSKKYERVEKRKKKSA